MKTRVLLYISALVALVSCGSARYATDTSGQRFQDGIYYTSDASATEMASTADLQEETDLLVAKTKSSPIFMKSGEKVDTLFIPNDKVAKIDFNKSENTTSVYLYDNSWDTWAAYQPWYASSWYSWHRPFYSSIYWGYSPWYYGGWYDPWYYRPFYHYGWYDPWYYSPYHYGWYGGWYDPWFYDPWYYDPWYYGGWYGHYGWYGGYTWHHHGWGHGHGPYWGGIGGGDRIYRPRVATTGSATRTGLGSASRSAGVRSSSMTRSRTGAATTRTSTATRSSGVSNGAAVSCFP